MANREKLQSVIDKAISKKRDEGEIFDEDEERGILKIIITNGITRTAATEKWVAAQLDPGQLERLRQQEAAEDLELELQLETAAQLVKINNTDIIKDLSPALKEEMAIRRARAEIDKRNKRGGTGKKSKRRKSRRGKKSKRRRR